MYNFGTAAPAVKLEAPVQLKMGSSAEDKTEAPTTPAPTQAGTLIYRLKACTEISERSIPTLSPSECGNFALPKFD